MGPEVGVDQVGVVTVEGGVGDAEVPLDGGEGRAMSSGGCFFEDGVDGGLDGVEVMGEGRLRRVGRTRHPVIDMTLDDSRGQLNSA